MQVEVTSVGTGWKPDNAQADFKPIYTILIKGQAEPQKTQDEALAKVGLHEAETYQTKSGKTYWRTAEAAKQAKQFVADPIKQESIEWQACLKAAVDAVRDFYGLAGQSPTNLADYKKDIAEALVTFTQTIKVKPITFTKEPEEVMVDKGDFAQVELPPVEVYDDVNLDDIPF